MDAAKIILTKNGEVAILSNDTSIVLNKSDKMDVKSIKIFDDKLYITPEDFSKIIPCYNPDKICIITGMPNGLCIYNNDNSKMDEIKSEFETALLLKDSEIERVHKERDMTIELYDKKATAYHNDYLTNYNIITSIFDDLVEFNKTEHRKKNMFEFSEETLNKLEAARYYGIMKVTPDNKKHEEI